jgi:predicted TIM-barrel fold metal-dependent hydrolase
VFVGVAGDGASLVGGQFGGSAQRGVGAGSLETAKVPHCVRPPSEYVHDHLAWTTQPLEEPPEDRMLTAAIEGLEPQRTLCFSSDYPDWDFDDPRQTLKRLPGEWRDAVSHGNAARFFGFETAVPA